ncbi:dual specificity protein phosphatase family protein [Armatimonas rosea]|uniref:Protein-tyrosine phosphatase n=1 Tax=Armatimonas rosea TaxID=685828 RepID=A0A7W9SQZ8_ARMRO|nr:dual specificity protein phosphatase [Armatimonas rosea]MBB6051187.1 protein-tyrosine phosphatase [Armatimonas rosea]
MDQVRPWLYVGKLAETLDYTRLLTHRIEAMLQLAAEVKQPGIAQLYLNVDDGKPLPPGALEKGVAFVREHLAQHETVLIACGAGMSRAPTFAIAVLCEEEGIGLLEAYAAVVAVRGIAMPHRALWRSLCEWRGEDVPYDEVLRLWKEAGGINYL